MDALKLAEQKHCDFFSDSLTISCCCGVHDNTEQVADFDGKDHFMASTDQIKDWEIKIKAKSNHRCYGSSECKICQRVH